MTLPLRVTTDMLDSYEPVYVCPRCNRAIRRFEAADPLRVMQAIVQHAYEHQRDADDWRAMFGEVTS